jgi:hypothetical protein
MSPNLGLDGAPTAPLCNAPPKPVTVTARRADDPTRWARLTLSLRDAADGRGLVAHHSPFTCTLQGVNESAPRCLEDWEDAIAPGVVRALRDAGCDAGVLYWKLAGCLADDDLAVLRVVGAAAVATALGAESAPHSTDWEMEVHAGPRSPTSEAELLVRPRVPRSHGAGTEDRPWDDFGCGD